MNSRPIKRYASLAFILLLSLAAPAPAGESLGVTIGIIGDQFGVQGRVGTPLFEKNKAAAYRALAEGVAALNRAGEMDTVLHVGDLTESTQDPDRITADFRQAAATLDALASQSRPKWFLAPGDHDVNPLEWVQDSPDRSRERFFKSLYQSVHPGIGAGTGDSLYYSFDIKGYHFIALYSHDHLRTDPRWGNVFFAKIGDRQMAWLEKDLAAASNARGIIVFTHQPLWYNWGSWERVHRLLARFNTRVVVAGHFHYDQADLFADGIQYRVVGAAGGRIKTANARSGGWWHVTRLTLADDGSLSWQLIPVDKKDAKSGFTSRYDMDRVQALAYIMGNAARNLATQEIRIKDGKLVDRNGNAPAAISLSVFGNPIDQPMDIRISVRQGSGYAIRSGRFEPGCCQESSGGLTCRASPGANMAASNNSTAQPVCAEYSPDFSRCLAFRPFWTGTIAFAGKDRPAPGDTVPLTLSLSFDSRTDGGPMKIWRDVDIPVRALP